MMSAMKMSGYFGIPSFVLTMKMSSDAKVLYSMLLSMPQDEAMDEANIPENRRNKVIKELEDNGLMRNGKTVSIKDFLRENKIVKLDLFMGGDEDE